MTVKSCEKLEKSRVALTIEVGAEEFEAAVNKAYLKMRGKMNIPGFRPGKAPRKMIESMYGAEVFYEEAVNAILPDAYESAVDEQKLEVVGYPQVEIENVGKEGATFKCTVAVYQGHGRRRECPSQGDGRPQQPSGGGGARRQEGRHRQHRLRGLRPGRGLRGRQGRGF